MESIKTDSGDYAALPTTCQFHVVDPWFKTPSIACSYNTSKSQYGGRKLLAFLFFPALCCLVLELCVTSSAYS